MKKLLIILFPALQLHLFAQLPMLLTLHSAPVSSGYVPYVVTNGLDFWFTMDSTNSGGNFPDSSGNGNIGTNTLCTLTPGVIGNAANFNGSAFISVKSLGFETGDFTVSGWYYMTNVQSDNYVLFGNGEYNTVGFYVQNYPANQLIFVAGTETSAVGPYLSNNTWYYIAFTKAGAALTLCVNGSFYSSSAPGVGATSSPFTIGAYGNSPDYTGLIDDFALFGRALSNTELSEIYTNGLNAYNLGGTH